MNEPDAPSAKPSRPEFSRTVKVRPHPPQTLAVEATPAERAALAKRLEVSSVVSLRAELALAEAGAAIDARGALVAEIVQPCAISGDDFAVHIAEPLALRFVRHLRPVASDEEAELTGEDADEIEFDGDSFDIGEAVTQSLALAIDPYATGPDADTVRREAGIVDEDTPRGALADALRALNTD